MWRDKVKRRIDNESVKEYIIKFEFVGQESHVDTLGGSLFVYVITIFELQNKNIWRK